MADGTHLIEMVRRELFSLPDAAAGVVVAVSGGADSVALLRALDAARPPQTAFPLVVAHFNHRLRGSDSDADEAFVAQLQSELSASGRGPVSLCRTCCDIAAEAHAQRENLEALARRERYRWLAETARTRGMHFIATGHTANDQAETVLHRLLRGTGLRGLRGIAARRELEPELVVVRPLLSATRADILAYLHELKQPFRDDASNRDPRYTRNRLRHELLPLLAERYNPAVVTVLNSLAQQADALYQEEETAARTLLAEAELPRAGTILVFHGPRLRSASRHRVREMFRLVWLRENWPLSGMDYAAWERVAAVVFGAISAVDLPGRVRIRSRERIVQVGLCTE